MNNIYGLIFDVDGVIADTEAVNASATIRVSKELFGLKNVTRKDFEKGLGRGAEAYILAAADVHGFTITDKQLAEAAKLREQYIIELFTKEPRTFKGVLKLINDALKAKDIRVSIATSSIREIAEAILKAVAVPYQQMVCISGDTVKNRKPHPELFLTAAKAMKVAPAACVVIEDAPSGVQAAKSAGCKCIAVTNTTIADNLSQADLIIDSLAEIDLEKIIALCKS
jgi:HAD superfamily hydrolase (TIGR01509 family)